MGVDAGLEVVSVLSFFVPGPPQAKGRPRFGRGRTYTDPQTVAAEHAVLFYAREAMRRAGWEPARGPVLLEARFVFAAPPSWGRKRREAVDAGDRWHCSRPDVDNATKLVADALNPPREWRQAGTELTGYPWLDDAQVCSVWAEKRWARDGEAEGTHVTVTTL